MPPTPPAAGPDDPGAIRRRRIRPLEQIPVWHGFEPGAGRDPSLDGETDRRRAASTSLLDGLNAEQRRAVTHGEGPLLVVAGAGTGKTQVITRRIAWLDRHAARAAVGDPRADVHGQGRRGDAAPRRPARAVRLRGHGDLHVPRLRRPADPGVRVRARAAAGRPRAVPAGGRRSSCASACSSSSSTQYRPLGDPTRFLGALASLFAGCRTRTSSPAAYLARCAARRAGRRSWRRALAGRTPARTIATRLPRRPRSRGGSASWPGAYARYQALLRRARGDRLRRPGRLALRLLRESPAARDELQARYRYILVDEFQDTNRAQSELVALLAERHRNVTVVGDDDQSIYRFRGAAISNILEFRERYRARSDGRPAPQLPLPSRRSWTRSHRLIRFNDPDRLEVRVGISKRLVPERPDRAAAPSPPPRLRDGRRGGGLDRGGDPAAGSPRARGRATTPCWFGRTPDADADPALPQPGRHRRGGSRGTSGLYARPEIRLLLALPARGRGPRPRASTCTRSPRRSVYGARRPRT